MDKFQSICWTAFLLFVILPTPYAAASDTSGSSHRVLIFSAHDHRVSSFLLKSAHGTTYRLSLVPQVDTKHRVVVLELVLQNQHERPNANIDPNLLDWTGKLHGYQPYYFAASDFAHGARKSGYGELRVIRLRRLGMEMRIKVTDVHVEHLANALDDQFDYLDLEITTRALA